MPNFLIRDIDDDVMTCLKERAKRRGRSLQQEVHEALAKAAIPTRDELKRMFEEFDAKHRPIPASVDIVEILREERDGAGCL